MSFARLQVVREGSPQLNARPALRNAKAVEICLAANLRTTDACLIGLAKRYLTNAPGTVQSRNSTKRGSTRKFSSHFVWFCIIRPLRPGSYEVLSGYLTL